MAHYFRVLVLDDDEEVLRRLLERVRVHQRTFEGKTFLLDLRPIRIAVEQSSGDTFAIDTATIERLATACSDPPHLILADFGYSQKSVWDELGRLATQGKQITEEDLAGKVLTTSELAGAVRRYCDNPGTDSYKRRILKKNLLGYASRLCMYSYAGKIAIRALGEIEARANRTQKAFPQSLVVPFDTKYLFYNGSEFDWPNESKHDAKFYAHLVAGLIDNVIRQEFLEHLLADSKRLKFVRVQRTALAVGFVVALGGAIGAASEWLGGRLMSLASSGVTGLALTFGILTVLWLFLMGFLLPLLFERVISGLLVDNEKPTEE